MLKKLMKYEFRSTARVILPLFGAVLFLGLVTRLFMAATARQRNLFSGSDNWVVSMITGILIFLFVALIIGVFVATFALMIQRFYRNLMSDEGYLMFTLPVRPWQHIVSKMLASGIWILGGVIVTFLAIMIMVFDASLFREMWEFFLEGIAYASAEIGMSVTGIIWQWIIYGIVGCFIGMLPIYCAIALGQLWSKHKVLGAFVCYIGISIVIQIITSTVMRFYVEATSNAIYYSYNSAEMFRYLLNFTNITMIISLVLSAACFFFTNYLLTHKLNLE